ncbi:ABC transporter permease [Spiroplasma endosymbiont of Tricholauxania praeusta]|uniref:ABC transporter permease n=1 Tax=Spiroplasma endosymbiont of Tricholauxania praeusta TaxID=3066296 RepID=UPI0030D137EA
MFKLLRNYIREQKNNLLQMFGLGFLVMIMIIAFLSLNFSNNYLFEQYVNDIAHNEFNQYTFFSPVEYVNFDGKYNEKDKNGSYLNNINYYQKDNTIDKEKMAKATFQLTIPDATRPDIYRFTFYGGLANSKEYFAIGDSLFNDTSHKYIDFKINIPINYPSYDTHKATIEQYANILNQYLYDPLHPEKNPENATNFMITSEAALQFYNDNFKGQLSYANRNYSEIDIKNEAKLYEIMSMGMLYKDIEWQHAVMVRDLLITSKNFAFIETGPEYIVNKAIIVKDGGPSLTEKPLQDNEILIYKHFAELNNLHIGQNYVIAGQTFIIRGYATSSLAAFVGRYFGNSLDLKNNTVAFTNGNTMHKVESDLKAFSSNIDDFFLGINPDLAKNIDSQINNEWIYNYLHATYKTPTDIASTKYYNNGIEYNKIVSPLNINNPRFYTSMQEWSFSSINNRINVIEEISSLFLILIFIVTTIIIFIITFKMIDRNKKLIGILKATGYKSWQLSISLVISIIAPLFIFAIIGVLISIPVAHYLIYITNISTVALISYGWYFNIVTAILLLVIPIISLTFISFLMVLFLLRNKPLDLITNNISKQKYKINISSIFTFIARYVIGRFSYRNKLAVTTSLRSFGKTLIMCFTSIFAATLVFFALAASGLVNNMLGSQFAGTNFNYQNGYQFDDNIKTNFINNENKLMYQFNSVDNIKSKISLYPELLAAIKQFDPLNPNKSIVINVQNRYIMGSELLKIKQWIDANPSKIPSIIKNFLEKNKILFNYLTNNNGKNNTDLLISFGLIPYDEQYEVPYTQLELDKANLLLPNQRGAVFDNDTQTLSKESFKNWSAPRTAYGIDDSLSDFLSLNFSISDFSTFSKLNLTDMEVSNNWQDKQFINIRNHLIQKLGIKNPDSSAVQFIPMATSALPSVVNVYNGGEQLNNSVIYRYKGLDNQTKYIIGVAYDYINKLDPKIIVMPKLWLNEILFGSKSDLLENNFANSKLSKFTDNEFKHYLPIISNKNDYNIDLAQISHSGYLESKGISTSLSSVYDISNLRSIMKNNQYSLQIIISFFGIFSVTLSLMIIIIVTNISVRDNLILINILRSLGYTALEVSYNFFLVIIPALVMSSLVAVFIVPSLVMVLSNLLATFAKIAFPIVFRWWYFALMISINILIYLVSYIITWKLNVNNKQLMTLTK